MRVWKHCIENSEKTHKKPKRAMKGRGEEHEAVEKLRCDAPSLGRRGREKIPSRSAPAQWVSRHKIPLYCIRISPHITRDWIHQAILGSEQA